MPFLTGSLLQQEILTELTRRFPSFYALSNGQSVATDSGLLPRTFLEWVSMPFLTGSLLQPITRMALEASDAMFLCPF